MEKKKKVWCCGCALVAACNLGLKTTTLVGDWYHYNTLTVSGSFSNTSLASSLVHFSSTHSLSKCPCFVSSKIAFALLCLLRNWFASWGDNETKIKDRHPQKYINYCSTRTEGQTALDLSSILAPKNISERLRNICG